MPDQTDLPTRWTIEACPACGGDATVPSSSPRCLHDEPLQLFEVIPATGEVVTREEHEKIVHRTEQEARGWITARQRQRVRELEEALQAARRMLQSWQSLEPGAEGCFIDACETVDRALANTLTEQGEADA